MKKFTLALCAILCALCTIIARNKPTDNSHPSNTTASGGGQDDNMPGVSAVSCSCALLHIRLDCNSMPDSEPSAGLC